MAENAVKFITMTSLNSATLTGAYKAINASGLSEACYYIRIYNASNRALLVSYDNGVTDHDYLPISSQLEMYFQFNSSPQGKVAQLKKGTIISVKAAAGTGYIYLSGYYT